MNTEIFDLGKIGITLGGEYDNEIIYEKLTIVLYKGKSYISTKTIQGVSPEEDILVWQLVAEAKDAYHMLVDAGKTTLSEEEFLEQLVDATKGRYIVQGNVINAADEEDLTIEHSDLLGIDTLRLANRNNTDGMGYIILRKNKSFAEQVIKENTIYEIRYDFTLNEDITIPVNCILKFEGGSISGTYTIIGQNTGIKAGLVKIFNTDITLSGTWNIIETYPEWFGAKGDGVNDDAPAINKTLTFGNNYKPLKVIFSNKIYLVGNSINISEMADITFEGTAKNVIKKIQGNYKDMIIAGKVKNLTINNLTFDGSFTDFNIIIPENAWTLNEFNCCMRAASNTTNVIFNNNIVQNFNYGIFCGGAYESNKPRPIDNKYYTEHITITNNIFELVKASAIDTYNQFGLFISNNYFKNCGQTAYSISIEPTEKRENMTSDPFNVESVIDSYALADGVTISDNKIYNDSVISIGGIKCFSGTIKVCIKNNFIMLAEKGYGIEITSPVMAIIDANTIQNGIKGISIWGLSGIVTVSNNKILDAKQVTISISRTTKSKYEMLNVFGNYFKLADVTDVTGEYSNCSYDNMTIKDNVFCNVSENNTQYSRKCALQIEFLNCRVYNNRLVKTKDTAVPYFIYIPADIDYNVLNAKIYDNISEQPLENLQKTSEPNHSGPTANRPNKKTLPYLGFVYNDTTLGKMVFAQSMDSEGVITWIDATGAEV